MAMMWSNSDNTFLCGLGVYGSTGAVNVFSRHQYKVYLRHCAVFSGPDFSASLVVRLWCVSVGAFYELFESFD